MSIINVATNQSLNTDQVKALFNPNSKVNSSGSYNDFFINYNKLDSKKSKSIRKAFQGKYNISIEDISKDGNVDTNLITKEMQENIFEVKQGVGLFKVKGLNNTLICVDLKQIFGKVQQVKK